MNSVFQRSQTGDHFIPCLNCFGEGGGLVLPRRLDRLIVKSVCQHQEKSAYPAIPWHVAEMKVSDQYRGVPVQLLITPKNNPLENSGLLDSLRQKSLPEARISQGRRVGTMG